MEAIGTTIIVMVLLILAVGSSMSFGHYWGTEDAKEKYKRLRNLLVRVKVLTKDNRDEANPLIFKYYLEDDSEFPTWEEI